MVASGFVARWRTIALAMAREPPLLAVVEEDFRQFGFLQPVHQIRRRGTCLRHAHVERAVAHEGKAARCLIQLHGGNAKIERHPVGAGKALARNDGFNARIEPLHQVQAFGKFRRQRLARRDGGGITVDAHHRARRRLEQATRIAAGAEGAVDINAAVPGRQHLDDFREHHRAMPRVKACRVVANHLHPHVDAAHPVPVQGTLRDLKGALTVVRTLRRLCLTKGCPGESHGYTC